MALRTFACVVVLLGFPLAIGAAPPVDVAPIKGCFDAEPLESLTRVERIGKSEKQPAYYVVGPKDRYLVFGAPDCEIFRVSTALKRDLGRWLSSKEQTTALVLPADEEPVLKLGGALLVRDAKDQPLAALSLSNCPRLIRAVRVRLFPDQDSLEVTCQQPFSESRQLIHAFDGQLIVLHDAGMGTSFEVMTDEKKKGHCALYPGGSIKVVRVGARPVIEIPDMEWERLVQKPSMTSYIPGIANSYQWTFNPDKRHFEKTSPAKPFPFDAYRGCRPR